MKRQALDPRSALTDSVTIKDKRTLVLFLLGILLLSPNFWPRAGAEVRHFYGIILGEATQPWWLLSLPVADSLTVTEAEVKAALGLTDHSTVLPLIPEKELAGEIPASLSLFLHCPLPINRADKAALEMLPWVGPHLAEAMLKELQQQGRFNGPEDLLEVSGVGPKKLQQLLPLISFE